MKMDGFHTTPHTHRLPVLAAIRLSLGLKNVTLIRNTIKLN